MKINKIKYLFFLFVMLSQCVIAQQTYFSKIYNPFNTDAIGRHIIELDSFYLVGGVGIDSLTNYQTLLLLKLSKSGNLLSIIKPGRDSIKYYPGVQGSLYKTTDNGFIWGGQKNNGLKSFGFFIKLDSSLNKEWEKEYMLNNDTVYSYLGVLQAKQTDDSGYILVGDIDASGQYNTDILLIKTDSLGNKLWQKTYNYIGADRGWNIIQTPDKGYLIGAGGYKAGVAKSYNGLVIKTDSLGNEQWRRSFGGMYDDDKCVVANHPDGNFIVATSYCIIDSIPSTLDDYGYKTINVIKLSPTNQVLWNKQYDFPKFWRSVSNISIKASGNIFVLGKWRGNDANSVQRSSLLKLNSNGDSLWYREFTKFTGHASDNALYDIKPTEDTGFVMCGQADAPFTPYQSQHIWVLKVDSFGCDTPGCHTVGIDASTPLSVHGIKVYPNPASDKITIEFSKNQHQDCIIEIYNVTGVLVRREKIETFENKYELDVKALISGLYLGKVIFNPDGYRDGEVGSFKFVVE